MVNRKTMRYEIKINNTLSQLYNKQNLPIAISFAKKKQIRSN
jgi:hypothetical protein